MSSVNKKEIEKFSQMAAEWWDPSGKFKPLHKFNPIRIKYIKENIINSFKLKAKQRPLDKINILDIGCGGGLLSEPMTRLGANVTGIDASKQNIEAASIHAKNNNLNINYIHTTVEELDIKGSFDIILNMEVVEHVNNQKVFIKRSCELLNKNGLIFVATLNKTLFSLIFAKYTAEYILNFLPRGTHDWNKFLTPEEVYSFLIQNNCEVIESVGINFNPLLNSWNESKSMKANFIVTGKKN